MEGAYLLCKCGYAPESLLQDSMPLLAGALHGRRPATARQFLRITLRVTKFHPPTPAVDLQARCPRGRVIPSRTSPPP